ncbi:hypothetical protein N7540_012322 [Penicillium herquei]|nr:hypothetical protein N7540_012322 [Penicillium herquei]
MPLIKKRRLQNSTNQSLNFLNEINSSYEPRQTKTPRTDIYDIPDSPEPPTFRRNGIEKRLRTRNLKPLSTLEDAESDEEPSDQSSEDQQMDDAAVQVPLETIDDEQESDEEPSNEGEDRIGNQLIQLELQEETHVREDAEESQELEAPGSPGVQESEESPAPEESSEPEEIQEPEESPDSEEISGLEDSPEPRELEELQGSQEPRGSENLQGPGDSWRPEDFWWPEDSREQEGSQEPAELEEPEDSREQEGFQEPEEQEEDEDYEEESEEGDDDEEENQRPPSETPQSVIENNATVVIYDKNQSKQPQPRTQSNKRRQKPLQTETEDIQTSQGLFPDTEYVPDYEDLPRDDPDLKHWLREKVRGTHMGKDWLDFYKRAYSLPEYVNGPLPSSFENALQLLVSHRELHVDLEDRPAAQGVPVNFKSKANNLCTAFFAEVEGLLNFPSLPQSESDPEKAGELVVDLEGYLLPYLASLAVLAFKAYTRFGPGESASSPFLKTLDVLFKIVDRIDALRDYYMTSRNRQRSWKLGVSAKRIQNALRKGQLRMYVTGDVQSSSEDRDVEDTPSVFDMRL